MYPTKIQPRSTEIQPFGAIAGVVHRSLKNNVSINFNINVYEKILFYITNKSLEPTEVYSRNGQSCVSYNCLIILLPELNQQSLAEPFG